MSILSEYLGQPLKKLFNSREFRSAAKKYVTRAESSPVSYGFQWFPEAGLTSAGPKFTYSDGIELVSYHVKGIASLGIPFGNNNINQYLCTISFPGETPFLFPGTIQGSVQLDQNGTFYTFPLGNGAAFTLTSPPCIVANLQVSMTPYGNNPQPNGENYYALMLFADTQGYTDSINALMSYDYEFLLPGFLDKPYVFQD